MAPITSVVEIARSPEDVFAYVDDLARHGEWQDQIVSVKVDTEGPTRVGTRATEVRKIGGREQTMTYEITVHDPPKSFGFRGLDGPIRPDGKGTIEPLDDGARSRLTLELSLSGHGLGKLILPLARRQAKKEVPASQQHLKERLESAAGG
jgi:uncharacterized membrane protein